MGWLPGGLLDDPCLFTEMGAWHQCCHSRGDRDRLRPEPRKNLGGRACALEVARGRREADASGRRTEGERSPMTMSAARGTALAAALVLAIAACSTTRQAQVPAEPTPPTAQAPSGPGVKQVEVFESREFIVARAKAGDTPETLAARHLGDPKKGWMIEDYMGVRTLSEGQEVVIPKLEWNPVGVFPWGYQLVPILVYHNISAQDK